MFTLFYTTFHNNTLQIWQQSLGITCSCIHRNSIWNKETKIKYCCFLFKQPLIFVLIHWTFLKFWISCFSHTLLSWLLCLMLPVSFTGSYTKDEPNFSLAKTAWPRPSKELNQSLFKDFWRRLLKFKIVQTMVISEGWGSIKNPTSIIHLISNENIQTLCDKGWLCRSKACCHFAFFIPLKYYPSSFWISQTLTLIMKMKRPLEMKNRPLDCLFK